MRGKPPKGGTLNKSAVNLQTVLGFRVFRPPLHAEVEAPEGWPARIKAQSEAGRSIRGKSSGLRGRGAHRVIGGLRTDGHATSGM